jgi:hypothetical protein
MAEGFSCSLDLLYGGLVISKLQFFIKKYQFFFSYKSLSIFGHQNPGSGLESDQYSAYKMLDPDPDSMNADPKHWRGLAYNLACFMPYL